MKQSFKNFFKLFIQSAWFYSRPILAFDHFQNWMAIVLGILITNIIGMTLTSISPLAFTLVNVGSFLGTVLCILPRHGSPQKSAFEGIFLIALGTSIGILLQSFTFIIILLFALGLYISGIIRNFSVGMYIRCIFGSIALLAGAQLRGDLPVEKVFSGLGAVILGMAVISIIYCLFSKNYNEAKPILINLYEQLSLLAQGQPSKYIHVRIEAREAIEIMPWANHRKMPWIYQLMTQADLIASSLHWQSSSENLVALKAIIATLKGKPFKLYTQLSSINPEIQTAISIIQDNQSFKLNSFKLLLPTREGFEEVKDILRSYKGSSARFAVRLCLTGLFCHFASLLLDYVYPLPLANHEFWVVISGCLMVMPGYHGTLGKITSRTLGSIVGACAGALLYQVVSSVNGLHPLWLMIFAGLLVIFYETVRKLSQAFLMFSVTMWLTFVLGGSLAGFTRLFDVIVGALIAFLMFFIFPTWHSQVLRKNIETWSSTLSSILFTLSHESQSATIPPDTWMIAYRIQGRINRSIQELILETPNYQTLATTKSVINQKPNAEQLFEMQQAMEELILELMEVHYYMKNNDASKTSLAVPELLHYQDRIELLTKRSDVEKTAQLENPSYFPAIDLTLKSLKQSFDHLFAFTNK